MSALKAPPGLAAAKEYLVSGLQMRVRAVSAISSGLQAGGSFDREGSLSKLAESDAQVQKGLAAISAMEQDLRKDIGK